MDGKYALCKIEGFVKSDVFLFTNVLSFRY